MSAERRYKILLGNQGRDLLQEVISEMNLKAQAGFMQTNKAGRVVQADVRVHARPEIQVFKLALKLVSKLVSKAWDAVALAFSLYLAGWAQYQISQRILPAICPCCSHSKLFKKKGEIQREFHWLQHILKFLPLLFVPGLAEQRKHRNQFRGKLSANKPQQSQKTSPPFP